MSANDPMEIFELMMNGNLKQGFELAAKKLGLNQEEFKQLFKIYANKPDMTAEELNKVYSSIRNHS